MSTTSPIRYFEDTKFPMPHNVICLNKDKSLYVARVYDRVLRRYLSSSSFKVTQDNYKVIFALLGLWVDSYLDVIGKEPVNTRFYQGKRRILLEVSKLLQDNKDNCKFRSVTDDLSCQIWRNVINYLFHSHPSGDFTLDEVTQEVNQCRETYISKQKGKHK